MKNKYIDEIHKIREENYEITKDMSFSDKKAHIHKGAVEFLKLVNKNKKN